MIKCPYCGYDVPQDDSYCGKCGKNLSYSRPITAQLGNSRPITAQIGHSIPLRTQPATFAGRVSRGIIRLTHVNDRPHGLNTIVRTIREAVEEREKAQRRMLIMTYIFVAVLMVLTLSVLYFELHMHGIMH